MGAFLTFLGVVIAIVVWWRRWTRAQAAVTAALKRTGASLDKRSRDPTRTPQTLEKDPKTGVYRVKGKE